VTKDMLPMTLYLPGTPLAGRVLDVQLKQQDGSFVIPVWGDKEKCFSWLREGGADLLCHLLSANCSSIAVSQKDRDHVITLFENSHGIRRTLHYEPEPRTALSPATRQLILKSDP
jgi:hypothetical protein